MAPDGGYRSVDVGVTRLSEERAFDRLVFACAVQLAADPAAGPMNQALGLSGAELGDLVAAYGLDGIAGPRLPGRGADRGTDALEEPDLRSLLLDHRTRGVIEEDWLAAIIARRSLQPNHLWQDLGLPDRSALSRMLERHFHGLAARNTNNMKWKKFFYRELCQREGVLVCRAPTCDVCADVVHCFGSEAGDPLSRLQAIPEFRSGRSPSHLDPSTPNDTGAVIHGPVE